MQYQVSIPTLMDFFCHGEHQGFAEADIQATEKTIGVVLPTVYRNYISFAKCADNLDAFLLSMLWDAAYGYNSGVRLTDAAQIDAALSQADIDRTRLGYQGRLAVCLDDTGETLYIHYVNGEYQELRTANRNKPAPQAKPVFEMPVQKYVPKGPYHIEVTVNQGSEPPNSIHIHPLIARVVERMYGKRAAGYL